MGPLHTGSPLPLLDQVYPREYTLSLIYKGRPQIARRSLGVESMRSLRPIRLSDVTPHSWKLWRAASGQKGVLR